MGTKIGKNKSSSKFFLILFCFLLTYSYLWRKKNQITKDMIDIKETLSAAEERMEMAAMYLEEELNRVRAGRANVAILSGVRVESYGQKVPLNQVANISTPDARTIAIKPWDSSATRLPRKPRSRCATYVPTSKTS